MKFLLDEQLHESTAPAIDAMAGPAEKDDSFQHILSLRDHGTQDEDIPPLCKEEGFDVLVTANVTDFGARKLYYQSLMNEGVHVVVLRPGKVKFTVSLQVALLAQFYGRVKTLLAEAETPTLIRVTQTSAEPRSLEDLLAEIEQGRRLP